MVLEHPGGDPEFSFGHEDAGSTIRTELGAAISGIIERDRFLQRAAQLVARHADQPYIAIYTRGVAGGELILRASTLPASAAAPARLSGSTNGRASVIRSTHGSGNAALIATLRSGDEAFGALVAFQSHGGFTPGAQAMVEALAAEIAPAIAVAERHHAIKQASVLDLTSGAYTNWFLNQRLEEEIERARRKGREVTVLLLNLQGMERRWHDTDFLGGTTLPRDLANVLTSSTRMFDVVAQRGPGAFAILLLDARAEDAGIVVDRLEARVALALERTHPPVAGVSVVISHASFPADGEDASALILTAEHRLDEALRRQHLHTR
jgi:diguanylate cyclase (GGDEF)-like protein